MKGLFKPGQNFVKENAAAVGVAAVVLLALIGWVAAGQIRSPAQIAADTAAPPAAPITVPVVERELASEVIVRGTVRYGAPRPVNIPTSKVKTGPTSSPRRPCAARRSAAARSRWRSTAARSSSSAARSPCTATSTSASAAGTSSSSSGA